jgi:hypothetical protein
MNEKEQRRIRSHEGSAGFEAALAAFRADPDYEAARQILASPEFASQGDGARAAFVETANFGFLYRSLRERKIRYGKLHNRLEESVLIRGERAVDSYRENLFPYLDYIESQFVGTSAGQCMERHAANLWGHAPYSDVAPQIMDDFRQLGVGEEELVCGREEMARFGYNPLAAPGMDGSFASFVGVQRANIRVLEDTVGVLRDGGVPLLEGASGASPGAVAGAVIVVIIVLGAGAIIASWAY